MIYVQHLILIILKSPIKTQKSSIKKKVINYIWDEGNVRRRPSHNIVRSTFSPQRNNNVDNGKQKKKNINREQWCTSGGNVKIGMKKRKLMRGQWKKTVFKIIYDERQLCHNILRVPTSKKLEGITCSKKIKTALEWYAFWNLIFVRNEHISKLIKRMSITGSSF